MNKNFYGINNFYYDNKIMIDMLGNLLISAHKAQTTKESDWLIHIYKMKVSDIIANHRYLCNTSHKFVITKEQLELTVNLKSPYVIYYEMNNESYLHDLLDSTSGFFAY